MIDLSTKIEQDAIKIQLGENLFQMSMYICVHFLLLLKSLKSLLTLGMTSMTSKALIANLAP